MHADVVAASEIPTGYPQSCLQRIASGRLGCRQLHRTNPNTTRTAATTAAQGSHRTDERAPGHASRSAFQTARDQRVEQLRVPPQSIEAEQAVLGGLMLAPDAYDRIADRITDTTSTAATTS
jgi:hypothetical protein